MPDRSGNEQRFDRFILRNALFLHHCKHRTRQDAARAGSRCRNDFAHAAIAFRCCQRVRFRLAEQGARKAPAAQQPLLQQRRLTACQPRHAAQALIQSLLYSLLHDVQRCAHPARNSITAHAGFLCLLFDRSLCQRTMLFCQCHPFPKRIVHQSSLLFRNVQFSTCGSTRIVSISACDGMPSSSSTITASAPALRR